MVAAVWNVNPLTALRIVRPPPSLRGSRERKGSQPDLLIVHRPVAMGLSRFP